MNKTPSILVDTGFEVDQNGALAEIVVPSVVTTLNAPRKITFNGTVLNYIPSTATALQELDCPNATAVVYTSYESFIKQYNALTSVKLPKLISIDHRSSSSGFVYDAANLQELDLRGLQTVNQTGGDLIRSCPSLTSIRLDSLEVYTASGGDFMYGSGYGFTTLTLPKLKTVDTGTSGMFNNMTNMTSFTLGSEGNPVQSLGSLTFKNCTQSGLTITIYTQGGAALSGAPWGATNATIEYEEA